ncbi:hypothetical protein QBC40DRAFT_317928 [Triangularia verruculosa]|uniref:Aminoglycoside phosphotransferase domain-containing protein n=1 Tax=Triangularia verruculosa TaxID=2587418 RepID=A0AAN7AVZ6_9PEZI|nr:hypothetical protein QBC40DRAFT_317928 [Triangularia verruculosa]
MDFPRLAAVDFPLLAGRALAAHQRRMEKLGHFAPEPSHMRVQLEHINSTTPEAIEYWKRILENCTQHRIGSPEWPDKPWDPAKEIDYTYADANEAAAIRLARTKLDPAIRTPEIYFNGKINGRQVLVRERLPGHAADSMLHRVTKEKLTALGERAEEIGRTLNSIKPDDGKTRNHLVADPNILTNGRMDPQEVELIFSDTNTDPDLGFMHNDWVLSNFIIDSPENAQIVGIIDWEDAGWFGWETAKQLQSLVKHPRGQQVRRREWREYFLGFNEFCKTLRLEDTEEFMKGAGSDTWDV